MDWKKIGKKLLFPPIGLMVILVSVSLCGALVAMLNLETAMFARFGADMPMENQRIFIILTGAGVSIAVVTLSVILIVNANNEIRRIKDGE